MKILFYIHGYPPSHNAGAEWMAYDMIESLKQQHEVTVITRNAVNGFQDGVNVEELNLITLKKKFNDADIVFTHLDFTGKAHNISRLFGKKNLYVIVHNTTPYAIIKTRPDQFNIVYNSEYTASLNYQQRSMICRPPLVPERYAKEKTGLNAITLVNCWPDKGGQILIDLARLMPERNFIGVLGGYGQQARAYLPNLTYIANSPDMAKVYADTEILIQPSTYESYGKAACEALSTGCAVICTDTPGLRESLSYAGIYVDRTAEAYKAAIEKMDIEKQLKKAKRRTAELVKQTETDLIELENFIQWHNSKN